MGRTFARINLASTNDFPAHKNDKIKGWVEHNGGAFSKEITASVTHLVASPRAWKSYVPVVKEARRLRTIHIVRLEWLEDSLLSKSRRPLDTFKYEYEHRKILKPPRPRQRRTADGSLTHCSSDDADGGVLRAASRIDKIQELKMKKQQSQALGRIGKAERLEVSGKKFDAECIQFEKDMAAKNYRPFVDSKGFIYLLTLVRKDKLRNRLEKHRVKVRYAPYFTFEHKTSYEVSHENPLVHHKRSHVDARLACDKAMPSIGDRDSRPSMVKIASSESKAILPPCPMPLYYFPKPYPYSAYPVLASALPRKLTMSNPHLRVRIPDPWAQGLQLFEYEPPNTGAGHGDASQKRTKEYACYTIYSRPGHRHVETLAPPGSTFDFAWNMFRKIFKQKVGVDWETRDMDREGERKDESEESRIGGEDGADDGRLWNFFGPLRLKQQAKSEEDQSTLNGGTERRPSATVVVNTPEVGEEQPIEVQARTPDGGW
ncbi:uncharacterized protein A1O9_12676 [Exophiala aquamarina CBS 119918]|uniref:BRCT domain-containing protein n=1 Tax=Exophiala aquamarina CBS 119918 TaxID=1182545 RepID=A0A072NUQ3_9EURO|nr:uncharacterized protein A1O9_12676 [Exophiala aquamarina CBS 119918]KEF51326.1 hypothetical protein A1O9_12676 [Exophiala aquamarina CBS 119918]